MRIKGSGLNFYIFMIQQSPGLIVTFSTINTPKPFSCYFLTGFGIILDCLEGFVIFICGSFYLCLPVAVYAPAHGKITYLFYEVHGFNRPVAGLALHLAG